MNKAGFKPIVGNTPLILILGSMPSEKSLQQAEYYAHPQNAFWPIMAELFGFDLAISYQQRSKQLKHHRIAVWDVIAACQREGSLDTAIVNNSIQPNDFISFFNMHPTIEYVFFNGTRAEQEFYKRVLPDLKDVGIKLKYQRLPSTSPANAGMSRQDKLRAWSVLKKVLEER